MVSKLSEHMILKDREFCGPRIYIAYIRKRSALFQVNTTKEKCTHDLENMNISKNKPPEIAEL